ncbi:hypothetical protein LCGC14_0342560 [marine sediment metagenome]|uniref:DUF5640 domain-containing protein n=1 Tax=marine sediment metagenome TaxID=412755 RepID=A0A0F9WL32_9ZZZZ
MKKLIFVILIALTITGCARSCDDFERTTQGNADYQVIQYSGGVVVGQWSFNGIVNSSLSSDGYYFIINDRMIEVSGTIKIIRID